MATETELAWNLLVELRKEIVSSQQIRAQVIGFKITFVSAGIGLIVANLATVRSELFIVPAFAAIFFDFLINSYSVSIKRKGAYCKRYLEPKLRKSSSWPDSEPLWEEFASSPYERQRLSLLGNLGITTLAAVPGVVVLAQANYLWFSIPLLFILVGLFICDVISYLKPRWIIEADLKKGHVRQMVGADVVATESLTNTETPNNSFNRSAS